MTNFAGGRRSGGVKAGGRGGGGGQWSETGHHYPGSLPGTMRPLQLCSVRTRESIHPQAV